MKAMRIAEKIRQAKRDAKPDSIAVLDLLEQIFHHADPTPEEDDLLLEWFFRTRRQQIKQLREDGLNALAKVEEDKLRSLPDLRNFQSYNGWVLRPGDRFFCDDRDNPHWDCAGDVLEYKPQQRVYLVRFDGPPGHVNPTDGISVDEVWPDSETVQQQQSTSSKWTNGPLIRLLDLTALTRSALEKRLSVFLCHASEDKARVRELYTRLRLDGFHPWLDSEALVPGDDWEARIRHDIQKCDTVLVCLTNLLIRKSGFVQTEIDFALEAAAKRDDGERYLIPTFLEVCELPPKLAAWHGVFLHAPDGYGKLTAALRAGARSLGRVTE